MSSSKPLMMGRKKLCTVGTALHTFFGGEEGGQSKWCLKDVTVAVKHCQGTQVMGSGSINHTVPHIDF